MIKLLHPLLILILSTIVFDPEMVLADTTPSPAVAHKVIIYYFHGTARCKTCKTIEAYTREAVETGFANNLKDGSLELKVLNVDEPENEHFIEDFQLTTRSVVVADLVDGQPQRPKTLSLVWQLVGSESEFVAYIQHEVASYLSDKK